MLAFDATHSPDDALLTLSRQELVKRQVLWSWAGSAGPAVHLAWLMGASSVILAGCDGADGHARCLDEYYVEKRHGGFGYKPAFDCMLKAIRALKIPVRTLSEGIV